MAKEQNHPPWMLGGSCFARRYLSPGAQVAAYCFAVPAEHIMWLLTCCPSASSLPRLDARPLHIPSLSVRALPLFHAQATNPTRIWYSESPVTVTVTVTVTATATATVTIVAVNSIL